MTNVRPQTMHQTELHLERNTQTGMRGPHGDELAKAEADGLLRRSEKTPWRGCGGGTDGGNEKAMEFESTAIMFTVPGTPVGKGRPRFAKRGNFVQAYTPEKTANYENLVKVKAEEAMCGRQVIDGPVSVVILLFVTPPASWSQKKQREALAGTIYPTTKPDVDNVIKGIFDACNEIVWRDDKQACDVKVVKRYAENARAVVQVEAL